MKTFDTLNPVTVFVFYAFAIGVPMFTLDPVIAAASLIFGVVFDVVSSGKFGKKYMFVFVLLTVFSLINPIFSQKGTTALFFINDIPITLESLFYGIVSSCAISAVIVWFFTFSSIMTSEKIMYLFGRISPKAALVISITLRFVPLYLKNYTETENALKCLGLYKTDTFIGVLRLKSRAFSSLLTRCTEDGIITADSMEVRGYGKGKRTFFSLFKFKNLDALLCAVFAVLGIISFIFTQDMQFYPILLAGSVLYANTIGYISYGILIMIPTFIKITEGIRWKLLLSKI